MNPKNTLIEVSKETKYKLKAVTALRGLKSYNEAVEFLIRKDQEVYDYLEKLQQDDLNENNNAQ